MADITKTGIKFDARGMDLEATLFSGQSFSWRRVGRGRFSGAAGGYAATLAQKGDEIRVEPQNSLAGHAQFWRRYLDLDTDYKAIHKRLCANATLARCVEATSGVRLLRQPFFDTLLAFILSQNNHIGRITQIVTRLREGFGERLSAQEHAFPAPQALAAHTLADLAVLRAGFRAKYLLDAAEKVASGAVSEAKLAALDDEGARALLCTITGVGPKVADCVLLFALGRGCVAPMDVWMKRAVGQLFGGGMPPEAAGCEGIAQQHIFCWARENLPRGGKQPG